MQKLKILLANLLRYLAYRLDPQPDEWNQEVLATLDDLVKRTAQFAEGTANEYKRQWVMHRIKKAYPHIRTALLSLHLEYHILKTQQ